MKNAYSLPPPPDRHSQATAARYGMVLAKEENDAKAMDFFIRSVHKYPMNWGCWLEMTSLISRVDEVCRPASMAQAPADAPCS